MDTGAARPFLAEIMERFLHPPPYIILTSSFTASIDRADMLNYGADACVEIPVDLQEILAILNAVLRREEKLKCVPTASVVPCIEYKELSIDPLRRAVKMRKKIVDLTPKEFDILLLLAQNPGVVFSKEQIYSAVWNESAMVGTSIVRDHISSLRQKLGLHSRGNEYIQTVFRVGYRFEGPK